MTVHCDVKNYLLLRYLDKSLTEHGNVINYFLLRYLDRSWATVVTFLSVAMTKVAYAIRGSTGYIRVQPWGHPR